jgi:phosphohistidine swiveling domain-containing protein
MTPTMTAPPAAIPVPPEFPVTWSDPAEAGLFWQQDAMHFPDPLAPLEFAAIQRALTRGFGAAFEAYRAPLERTEIRSVNGYLYQAMVPYMGAPEEMAERGAQAEAIVRDTVSRLGEIWEREYLPEIQDHIAWWEAFDPETASRQALLAHLDETWERTGRIWELHFRLVLALYPAISEFDELYRGLFEDAGPLDSYRLLEGLPNMTVKVGQELWILSRRAMADDEVRSVLESRSSDQVVPALMQSAGGRAFLAELGEYLANYGRRSDKWTISAPSWVEDPAPAIKNLRDYITQPDSEGPVAKAAEAAVARDAAIAEARERLIGYPAPIRGQFDGMLAAAQVATVLSEDHNFWIDNVATYYLRQVIVAVGRRLVADDALTMVEDVFFLEPEELRDALENGVADMRYIAASRAHDLELQAELSPPPVLGTMPPGPPPADAMGRSLAKFFGTPPAESEVPGEIRGAAGSRGFARGTARVIKSISEASRLQPGDILVAETTAPPWTPLFATAGAIVADTGGVLSHAAVVAREYGVPAVVGTGVASKVIADGMTIEVDGDAGIVRIV